MNFVLDFQCFFIILRIVFVYGACTLPIDGQWWDSRTGTVTITQSSGAISGWSITSFSNTATAFTCIESDSSHWLFKSHTTLPIYGLHYYVYFCVKYTKITDYSYSYYLNSNAEPDAGGERIKSLADGSPAELTTSDCNPTSGPGVEEFHVLVQKDRQADVKQWFPTPLLGVFAYEVTDNTNSGICGVGSVWDGCTNRTTISFNYTQCSTTMFDSTDGELYATKYYTSGSTSYVSIIDSTASSSQRFTCLAVSGSSVSSNPGSCAVGQSATSRTSDTASVLISLSAYETCPFTSDSDASSSSSSLGIIAGVVVVLLIIIAVVAFILYYKCYKKQPFPWQKSRVQNGSVEKGEKTPPADVMIEPLTPHSAVEVEGKKKTLPPLGQPSPMYENQPVPSNTRQ